MKIIESILQRVYDTTVLEAPGEAILWAAERIAGSHGPDVARKQFRAAYRKRNRLGKFTPLFPWGHELFDF
jgi:hypothetical protein